MTAPRKFEGKDAKRPRQPWNNRRVVDLAAERRRRRTPPAPSTPTLHDAALALLGIRAEAEESLFLDSADVIAKLAPVWRAVFASLPNAERNQL